MPFASAARPISPPSASTSRTRCPFAVPPIAGWHGIAATVSSDIVHTPTLQPRFAAAQAASHPACPAPITTMSKRGPIILSFDLFPNTEPAKYLIQQVFSRSLARQLLQRGASLLERR